MDQSRHLSPLLEIDENEVSRNKRSIPWVRLIEGLQAGGCPLCEIVNASMHKHVDSILYEYVNDVGVRKVLHSSFGFCNRHAWLAKDVELELHSDGQHLATLHESLLHAEIRLLEEASATKRTAQRKRLGRKAPDPIMQRILNTIRPVEECMICAGGRRAEEFYAGQCALMYTDDEFRSLFEAERILPCRPHFITLVLEAKEPEALDYFLRQQIIKLKRLYDQLKLFLEKHDVRYKDAPHGAEWTSWIETLEHFSSKPGIDRPWDRPL
ncbi:MAG TPA: DUF6062 family protein [Bacteroidota bacterium]|nr:DUF6062 family protein [Bacteroidota bacterium]